tara:strand:+ start:28998 stop:29120 length:123 start_codon:yes stop_codon:yes gene_type:complete
MEEIVAYQTTLMSLLMFRKLVSDKYQRAWKIMLTIPSHEE